MRKSIAVPALLGILLAAPALARAENPPARPLPFTAEQYAALQQIQTQADHLVVLDVKASYKSQREKEHDLIRASDDFWTVAHNAGFPATILILLICAAPL